MIIFVVSTVLSTQSSKFHREREKKNPDRSHSKLNRFQASPLPYCPHSPNHLFGRIIYLFYFPIIARNDFLSEPQHLARPSASRTNISIARGLAISLLQREPQDLFKDLSLCLCSARHKQAHFSNFDSLTDTLHCHHLCILKGQVSTSKNPGPQYTLA